MLEISTWKYIWLTIKHKVFVFKAGIKIGVPIYLLIIHDWSKFTFKEAPHYGRQFFGDSNDSLGFSKAWNNHQKNNPHHWEYWVMVTGHNRGGFSDGYALPMPEKYIKEMIADWLGASRAYEGNWPQNLSQWNWWQNNFNLLKLHKDTRECCIKIIEQVLNKKE